MPSAEGTQWESSAERYAPPQIRLITIPGDFSKSVRVLFFKRAAEKIGTAYSTTTTTSEICRFANLNFEIRDIQWELRKNSIVRKRTR
jgi:hypothetical protein